MAVANDTRSILFQVEQSHVIQIDREWRAVSNDLRKNEASATVTRINPGNRSIVMKQASVNYQVHIDIIIPENIF